MGLNAEWEEEYLDLAQNTQYANKYQGKSGIMPIPVESADLKFLNDLRVFTNSAGTSGGNLSVDVDAGFGGKIKRLSLYMDNHHSHGISGTIIIYLNGIRINDLTTFGLGAATTNTLVYESNEFEGDELKEAVFTFYADWGSSGDTVEMFAYVEKYI